MTQLQNQIDELEHRGIEHRVDENMRTLFNPNGEDITEPYGHIIWVFFDTGEVKLLFDNEGNRYG